MVRWEGMKKYIRNRIAAVMGKERSKPLSLRNAPTNPECVRCRVRMRITRYRKGDIPVFTCPKCEDHISSYRPQYQTLPIPDRPHCHVCGVRCRPHGWHDSRRLYCCDLCRIVFTFLDRAPRKAYCLRDRVPLRFVYWTKWGYERYVCPRCHEEYAVQDLGQYVSGPEPAGTLPGGVEEKRGCG